MKRFFAVLIVLVMAFAMASCGDAEKAAEVQTDPNWKDSGKPPISILKAGIVATMASDKTIEVELRNISTVPVTSIDWMILLFDDSGKLLEEFENTYAWDVAMRFKPGDTETAQSFTKNEQARNVKMVIKAVTYEEMNPVDEKYGMLSYVWENSNFAKELEEARK